LAGACTDSATSLGVDAVSAPFADSAGATVTLEDSSATLRAVLDGDGLVFKKGGTFKLCYSSDGSFGTSNTDVLDVTIDVAGVFDSCATADCLSEKRYNCYALRGAHSTLGSCAVSFGGTGQGFQGGVGKVSWSAAWLPSWNASSGALKSVTRQACSTTTPDSTVMCPQDSSYPYCQGSDIHVEPDASQANKVVVLPQSQNLSNVSEGYTLAACYCPDLGGCDSTSEYVQQIGVLHIFASKLCATREVGLSLAYYSQNCVSSAGFNGVAPGHEFNIMVYCPPGGCPSTTASRIKLVDAHADNDRPSWDPQHGCHSRNETALLASPENCDSVSCSLTGGIRQDRKIFPDSSNSSGFRLDVTGADLERLNFYPAKGIDICFCDDSCLIGSNWFKVGSVVFSPYLLANLNAELASIVNVPGKLGFYRSSIDENSVGLEDGSLVKVLPDPTSLVDDSRCGSDSYDTTLVPGFSYTESVAKFSGQPYGGATSLLVFDGGIPSNTYTFTRAGFVAVCYCRPDCLEMSSDWVLASRYVIRGPTLNQAWTFSTGLAVRLTYEGFGLNAGETLRVAPSTLECTDFSGNPHTETSLQVGCPNACTQMLPTLGASAMNLAAQLLTHDSVRCGVGFTDCETVYVSGIVVLNATSTRVEFSGNPGLTTGDHLALGAGVQCGIGCSNEQLTAITGVPSFGNSGKYDVGNPVTATSDANRFIIPVGWTGAVPKFEVVSGRGEWKRTNAASTAEELKGISSREGLKVCWGYGGSGTYVSQLGTVAFVQPPDLTTSVSLTTRQEEKTARIVISFTTGNDKTEYTTALNSLLLKIVFTDVRKLEPHFTNQVPLSAVQGWDENKIGKASQAACGKLFHELWGQTKTDDPIGFPLPKGCYYNFYGHSRELFILFDKGNSLQPGKAYQLVLSATAKSGVFMSDKIVSVFSMNDIVLKPYEAIEAGSAAINIDILRGPSSGSPQFADPNGFTIIGGTSTMVELRDELRLRVQLSGRNDAGISKLSIIRMFMWPLTQWYMSTAAFGSDSCVSSCTPYPGTICSQPQSCTVEAVVASVQTNIIKVQLSEQMTTIEGAVKHVIDIRGVTLPVGGFFPGRIAAQVSVGIDDSKPHYVISSGDYLWKQSATAAMVAELVTNPGDGNSKPFRGASGNVLHVHLLLATTLFVDGYTGFASMTVRMPPGYECTKVSATPRSLSVFSSARGNGTLDMSRWLCTGNVCTYTLEPYGVIFAGSSIYASFTVTNPLQAMPRNDAQNKWYFSISGSGQQTSIQASEDVAFSVAQGVAPGSTLAMFGTSVAVLGTLSSSCLQPTDFRISSDSEEVTQDLFIFFETQQSAGFGAYVVLDGPVTFDFGETCVSQDLDVQYYSTMLDAGKQTFPLPGIVGCSGSMTIDGISKMENRARIQVVGHLRGSRRYGFRLQVTNPKTYDVTQQRTWQLWTMSQNMDYIDGSQDSLNFQLASSSDLGVHSERSWGMYNASLSDVTFQVVPLLPYSLSMQEATITMFPLSVTVDVNTTPLKQPSAFSQVPALQPMITNARFAWSQCAQPPQHSCHVLIRFT
jgi:hypothetical protein